MRNQTNSLKANAILNMFRRGSATLFPLFTFIYASRTLGAEGIGIYSFCSSVLSYFSLLASLGIGTYAVREGQSVRDNPEQLRRFISEVYTINFMMTLLSYVLLGVLVLAWGKLYAFREIVFIISASMMLGTIGADWINTLLEDYLFITLRYIAVQMICLVALVILVRTPADLRQYALIGMLSSVGGNLLNIWHIRRRIPFRLTRHPHIRRHIGPMITLFSNSLAIVLYIASDVVLLGIFMENRFVGYYTAASKAYTAVKEMINAMILVTVPRFSFYVSHNMREAYQQSFSRVLSGVLTLAPPCVAGLYMEAEHILYFFAGPEYVEGVWALKILSLALIPAVGACLFAHSVLLPYKQERFFLKATIISAITNIVLNFPLIPLWGLQAAALTTLVSEMIVFCMTLYKGKPYLSTFFGTSGIWKSTSGIWKSAFAGTGAVVFVCGVANCLIPGRLPNLLVSVIASVFTYAVITYVMGNQMVVGLLNGAWNIAKGRVCRK